MAANRRKRSEPAIIVGPTASSGSTADSENASNADRVSYWITLSALTAGDITFKIQSSPNNGVTWYDLTTSEMNGNTGTISATGNYHVSAEVPFGFRTRLAYTINTGPAAFALIPIYERTGAVHS